ncbi:hypothetical protein [Actinacidiphila yeochonensis]|nr:hypothetical protein [Actinacidiphila yeochonensis]
MSHGCDVYEEGEASHGTVWAEQAVGGGGRQEQVEVEWWPHR